MCSLTCPRQVWWVCFCYTYEMNVRKPLLIHKMFPFGFIMKTGSGCWHGWVSSFCRTSRARPSNMAQSAKNLQILWTERVVRCASCKCILHTRRGTVAGGHLLTTVPGYMRRKWESLERINSIRIAYQIIRSNLQSFLILYLWRLTKVPRPRAAVLLLPSGRAAASQLHLSGGGQRRYVGRAASGPAAVRSDLQLARTHQRTAARKQGERRRAGTGDLGSVAVSQNMPIWVENDT